MVQVLLNWLYIAFTNFVIGYGVLSFLSKKLNYKIQYTISYFISGFLITTVYAQVYSLISGVGIFANVLMIVICIAIICIMKGDFKKLCHELFRFISNNKILSVVFLALMIIMIYGTSRGNMHFDSSLYHAQSIRWIEEYGIVPGLANLHSRFGYNSAAYATNALYSMSYIFPNSIHASAGYLAFFDIVLYIRIKKCNKSKEV